MDHHNCLTHSYPLNLVNESYLLIPRFFQSGCVRSRIATPKFQKTMEQGCESKACVPSPNLSSFYWYSVRCKTSKYLKGLLQLYKFLIFLHALYQANGISVSFQTYLWKKSFTLLGQDHFRKGWWANTPFQLTINCWCISGHPNEEK